MEKTKGKPRRLEPKRKPSLSDEAMREMDANWHVTTPEQRLAWFNSFASRPGDMGSHWREILDLANYFRLKAKIKRLKAGWAEGVRPQESARAKGHLDHD